MVNIDEVAKANEEYNEAKKKLEKLKAEIKKQGEGNYDGSEYRAIVEKRVSSKLNPEKTLQVVKDLGAKWLLKEVVNEEALEDSIATGEIDATRFTDCMEEKTTLAVKFIKIRR